MPHLSHLLNVKMTLELHFLISISITESLDILHIRYIIAILC